TAFYIYFYSFHAPPKLKKGTTKKKVISGIYLFREHLLYILSRYYGVKILKRRTRTYGLIFRQVVLARVFPTYYPIWWISVWYPAIYINRNLNAVLILYR